MAPSPRPAPADAIRVTRPAERTSSIGTLPPAARLFVAVVIVGGTACLIFALQHAAFDQPQLLAVLLLLAGVASSVKLRLPLTHDSSSLSVSYAIDFGALLVLGPAEATLVAATSAWSQCTFRMRTRNPLHRTLFSIAALAVTMQGTGFVFALARGSHADLLHGLVRPLFLAVLVYYALNTALVAMAVALSNRQDPVGIWRDNFMWSAPSYFIGASAAAVASIVFNSHGFSWWMALVAAPAYLTYRSYRQFIERIEQERAQVRRVSGLQLAIIEALTTAIEAKDRTSPVQIRRMQDWAVALGRAVGLPPDEIVGLQTATLLHDIGNLAVPEHILLKPSALTEEEFDKVRIHPRVGAEILEDVPFPYPVAPLVLHHHEHWDGSGYPAGLIGEAIPLAARILAVVDSYFALSNDRPHRPALAPHEVIYEIEYAAGRILDPSLVGRFLALLPELEEAAPAAAATERTNAAARPPAEPGVLEDIAVAHQEARALYQIAQALGSGLGMAETMELIATSLRILVPFTSFALFIRNENTRLYTCRHAAGIGEERLRHLTVASPNDLAGTLDRVNRDARPGQLLQSVVIAPLELEAAVIGVLAIYHTTVGLYRGDHRRVLARVADQAAPVVRNSLVFERTQQESFTDQLTGLPNRRAMLLYLNQQMARAERRHSHLAVVMMDMNDFKDINDTLGHQVGDRALREVSAVLRSMVRAYDLCVRYGGDEFVAILWECDAEQAGRRHRELKEAVRAIYVEGGPGQSIHLSVSAGFAVYPDDGRSEDDLIAVADRRMYEDKAAFRRASLPAVTAAPAPDVTPG